MKRLYFQFTLRDSGGERRFTLECQDSRTIELTWDNGLGTPVGHVAADPQDLRVLRVLLNSPRKVITKDDFLEAIWQGRLVTEDSLTGIITRLRRKILRESCPVRGSCIETLSKREYRFIREVKVVEDYDEAGPMAGSLTRIDTVTPIHSNVRQTIMICGQGFGSRPEELPIAEDGIDTVGDSYKTSMAILNLGEGPHRWSAGRKTETNLCAIGVRLRSWTDTRIVLAGFAGPIGTDSSDTYQISEGDRLKIVVFGPANRCGPGGLPECPDDVRHGRVAVFETVVYPPIAQCDHTKH